VGIAIPIGIGIGIACLVRFQVSIPESRYFGPHWF